MKRLSYVFAGSSEASIRVFEILLKQKGFQCKGLITQPDKPRDRGLKKQANALKKFAQSHQIPCWTPLSCGESSFLKEIRGFDFCFVCAYGKILPAPFLDLFPKRCLNLHFSLLPRWRGAAPIQRALMEGDLETGVSLQVMTEELDAGDLIGSKKFSIEESDNSLNLFEKSFSAAEVLLRESLLAYLEGKIKAVPQDSSFVTYAKKIDKKSAQINWREGSREIHNKVRALYLGPQAFSFFEEEQGASGKSKETRTQAFSSFEEEQGMKGAGKEGELEVRSSSPLRSSFSKLRFPKNHSQVCESGKNLPEDKKTADKKRLKIYRAQINTQTHASGFNPGEICQVGKNSLSIVCGKGALDLLEVQKEGKKKQRIQDFLSGRSFQLGDRLS